MGFYNRDFITKRVDITFEKKKKKFLFEDKPNSHRTLCFLFA
jgi:hypothetical protein